MDLSEQIFTHKVYTSIVCIYFSKLHFLFGVVIRYSCYFVGFQLCSFNSPLYNSTGSQKNKTIEKQPITEDDDQRPQKKKTAKQVSDSKQRKETQLNVLAKLQWLRNFCKSDYGLHTKRYV